MRRAGMLLMVIAVAGMGAAPPEATAEGGGPEGLTATIQLKGRYYRVGEPLEVRVLLENLTDHPVPNPDGLPILAHLELLRDGDAIRPVSVPEFDPATQPRVFTSRGGYLRIVELTPHFPDLARPGVYQLRFRAGEIETEIDLIVAPPYDPALDYSATFKTDFGEITFDLLEAVAPDHVRNFVDLARRDFYDGTLFHIVAKGEVLGGGDPAGDGTGGTTYFLPPELSKLPHTRGTLAAVQAGGADNGSQFFINLRRSPERDGKYTIFGQMTSGEEALEAVASVATTGLNQRPFYRPLKDVVLRDVVVHERSREAAAEGDAADREEATEEGEPEEGSTAGEGRSRS